MPDLALPSFHIQGFRGLSDLRIERLGRVNLIVGKNNVGKSSLLEAFNIYASGGAPSLIWDILGAHDEGKAPSLVRNTVTEEYLFLSLTHLFNGRNSQRDAPYFMRLGPLDLLDKTLTISIAWLERPDPEEVWNTLRRFNSGLQESARAAKPTVQDLHPLLIVQMGKEPPVPFDLDRTSLSRTARSGRKLRNCIFLPPDGLVRDQVAGLWDSIALTDLQEHVLSALRIIAPGIEGISLVVQTADVHHDRIPIIRVSATPNPIPLRNLGDGMVRMLGIALALVNARDGILLVDEIENGLHYLVQPDLWRLIFQTARQLNVQVFATTHSWDCIQAFQQVAQEDKESEGMLIRLEARNDTITATLFDEEELGIAAREQIEVR